MKPRSKAVALRVAAGGLEQGGDAGLHLAGAHALQALADEDAVVAVELDHVGDGAQRDEVEQAGEVGFRALGKPAALAQFGAQGEHDVEHHADAGDALGREIAAGLVGIDDALGVGQGVARQVVVGDQRGDAVLLGAGDAFQAGDAVVDGDDQVGRLLGGDIDDFRRQAVAELEAVGEQEIDIGAERFQGAHADGGGGGAVAVVVADDQQLRFGLDGIGQQLGGVGGVGQGGGGAATSVRSRVRPCR
jgi:hypothetical protein